MQLLLRRPQTVTDPALRQHVLRTLGIGFDLARRAAASILLVYGAETPPKSRAEIEALAALPGIRIVRLPRGKLSVHEEFPDATMEAIEPFLSG